MKEPSRLLSLMVCVLLTLFFGGATNAAAACKRTIKIGILLDGSTPGDKALSATFKQEIASMLGPDVCATFPSQWELDGKDSREGVREALSKLLRKGGPDVVLALGVISSLEVLRRGPLPKPVIAPLVPRFAIKGSKGSNTSNVKNLIYIDSIYYLDKDIEIFKKVVHFHHVAIVLDKRELYSIPDVFRLAQEFGERHGLKVSLVPAMGSAQKVLQEIPGGVDAVLVGPLWHFSGGEFKKLVEGLKKRHLPSFGIWDRHQVEMGLLAGAEASDKEVILARRTAVAIMDILQGEAPHRIEVKFKRNRELTINMATARAISIYPDLLVMTEATLLNEEPGEVSRRLNIKKAVEEAISANLRLKSVTVDVMAGEHKVKEERADLLPRIDLATGYRIIDSDRARQGAGVSPQRAWTGTAGGSILLYSDKIWAKYRAQEHLQRAREMRREKTRLDVTYDASVAYLNVLRAKTIERIYKENLALTKANLERAKIKVETGAAGPDEVYRWESKFANDRRLVLYRESDTLDAMEALNRILHRPLDEQFVPEEATLKDPLFMVGDNAFFKFMENPLKIQRFKEFATREAVEKRPEIKVLDSLIEAKERLKKSAKRQLWLPDFTVEWNVDQYLAQDGHGDRDNSSLDDTDWNVGVFARIPLFEGGKTYYKARRLQEEVSKLYVDKDALVEAIYQEVMAAINKTRASYPSIWLTRDAEVAAKKNLDLVTDSYVQGIKNIIDLLDAQNQYLNAKLDAANAVYNFLIDFMGVQRAMGEFVIFLPGPEREQWLATLKEILAAKD